MSFIQTLLLLEAVLLKEKNDFEIYEKTSLEKHCIPLNIAARENIRLLSYLKNGKIDLGDSKALIEYNKTVLRLKYSLNIDIPPGQLIPAVCLRSLFIEKSIKPDLNILEIGTGGTAILAMMMARMNCKIVATEVNELNFNYAKKNVKKNHLGHLIKVCKAPKNKIIKNVIQEGIFDRIISYPPQYSIDKPMEFSNTHRGFGGTYDELIGGKKGYEFSLQLLDEICNCTILRPNGYVSLLLLNKKILKGIIETLKEEFKGRYRIIEVKAGTRVRYIFQVPFDVIKNSNIY